MQSVSKAASPNLTKPIVALLLAALALFMWAKRDLVAAWFATSYTATIQVTVRGEQDDTHLQRAFAAARAAQHTEATLEAIPGLRQIRDSVVHVQGATRAEAIATAGSFVQALLAAFNAEGPGHITARVGTRTEPVPGGTNQTVRALLTFGAPALGLAAAGLLWAGWHDRRTGLAASFPAGTGFAVAPGLVLLIAPFVLPGWLIAALFAMAIPTAIAGIILYKMRDVRRAAQWPAAQGRIVHARTHAVRRKQPDGSTSVSNALDIKYAYSVGDTEYRGKRISIGDIPPGSAEVEAALERYQVGSTGPVFYNPARPQEAVLERDPPVSPTAMYAIAIGVMLVGFAVVITFTRVSDIIAWLEPYFPPGAVLPGFLFCTVAGVVVLLSLLSSRRAALTAARWPTTPGTVVSSSVQSRWEFATDRGGQRMQVWSPLVEFSYHVGGRNYHSARVAFGPDVGGDRALAEATVSRYPAGSAVTVHYDPANPSVAVLETRVAFGWVSLLLAAALFAAALFFSGWRGFG